MKIANPTFRPLYQQIKALLLKSLQNSEWKPGEPIPSETGLALRYGVSQGTVRKAIDELAAENLVVRKQGRGTFVASHTEVKAQYRFLRLLADDDSSEHPKSSYLSLERIRANSSIAQLLDIKPSESVFVIKRVLEFRGRPQIFDEICLPAQQYRGLSLDRLQQPGTTLYGFLETHYGMRMLRATEKIKAVAAQAEHAKLLNVPLGMPLLQVERLSMTYADRPVELRMGWYLTDAFSYRNELY